MQIEKQVEVSKKIIQDWLVLKIQFRSSSRHSFITIASHVLQSNAKISCVKYSLIFHFSSTKFVYLYNGNAAAAAAADDDDPRECRS